MTMQLWRTILEDARWYPSPHNSQPIKVGLHSPFNAEFFYDKKCGLPAEDYGIPFGFVCVGVFLSGLEVAARARGFDVKATLYYDDMDFQNSQPLHKFADIELIENPQIDINQAEKELETFLRRQTSRRPYDNKLVSEDILQKAIILCQANGQQFRTTNEQKLVDQIIDVNQRTLFDDLQRDPVYHELMQWLRFSNKEAKTKADGLSASTLLMPGRILKFAFKHRGLWHAPIVGRFFQWVYLRTMRGVRQVGWLEGPFAKNEDYIRAGQCFMKLWLLFTEHGVCLHPYGTVITNPKSHKRFAELVGADETNGQMAWMLFRFGYSKQPPHSERRPLDIMIVEEV